MTLINANTTTDNTETKRAKSAVDAPRGNHFLVDPSNIVIIGLDTKDGPEHPLFDKRKDLPLLADRVQNFMYYGALKPILVQKDGDKLIAVDGRQRVRYLRAANAELAKRGEEQHRIKVIVVKGDGAHLFGMSRAANIHTADDKITTARDMQRYIDMGRTPAEVAMTFGVSESSLRNHLAMLDLAPEIQAEISAGEIGTVAAVQLAALPQAEQAEVVAEAKAEAKATGKKVTSDSLAAKAREKAGKAPSTNTPSQRIAKADTILRKLCKAWIGSSITREQLEDTLDKLSRVITGKSTDKLCEEIEKENAAFV